MSVLSRKPKTGRRPVKRSRRVFLEVLEQRLLLFSDPFFSAYEWTAAVDLELFVENSAAGEILTLVDRSSNEALASAPLSDITEPVRIVGSPHDDTLLLALQPLYVSTHLPQGILFDGGAGNDTLLGPSDDTTWNVTGSNSGNLGGPDIVEFSSVENLTGHADNEDTFVFSTDGSLSGLLEGGDGGFDSIILEETGGDITYIFTGPDSGSIERFPGDVITYSGFEPISTVPSPIPDTPTNVTLNYNTGTITIYSGTDGSITVESTASETVTFSNPSGTITINASSENDTINIQDLGTFSGTLAINAGSGDDTIDIQAITNEVTYPGLRTVSEQKSLLPRLSV